MHVGHVQYLPIAPPLFALLAGALALLLILVQIRVLRYAYMQRGVSSGAAFFLLFGSLLGGYVNIPIAALGQESMVTEREVSYFGMRYVMPMIVGSPHVILAVNVGVRRHDLPFSRPPDPRRRNRSTDLRGASRRRHHRRSSLLA